MIIYYSFYVYILILASGLFAGILAVRRQDVERALTMLIVVLLAWIGLSTSLDEWFRVFAGIYHIAVSSWG